MNGHVWLKCKKRSVVVKQRGRHKVVHGSGAVFELLLVISYYKPWQLVLQHQLAFRRQSYNQRAATLKILLHLNTTTRMMEKKSRPPEGSPFQADWKG